MSHCPGLYADIGKKARGLCSCHLLLRAFILSSLPGRIHVITNMFSSDLILLDVLYRGYAQQPPVHFQYHCLDVNGDLSFRSKYSPTLA